MVQGVGQDCTLHSVVLPLELLYSETAPLLSFVLFYLDIFAEYSLLIL